MRWLIWFAVGVLVSIVFTISARCGKPCEYTALFFGVIQLGWLGLTALAVPYAIIRWLTKPRGQSTRHA